MHRVFLDYILKEIFNTIEEDKMNVRQRINLVLKAHYTKICMFLK